MGGWIALAAIILLGARTGRYAKDSKIHAHPPSNIPFLALGAWILTVGWFGLNVMSAQSIKGITGLVAVCAGSDVMHPLGALATGAVAGVLFVWAFTVTQNRLKLMTCLAYSHCTACVALGVALRLVFLVQKA